MNEETRWHGKMHEDDRATCLLAANTVKNMFARCNYYCQLPALLLFDLHSWTTKWSAQRNSQCLRYHSMIRRETRIRRKYTTSSRHIGQTQPSPSASPEFLRRSSGVARQMCRSTKNDTDAFSPVVIVVPEHRARGRGSERRSNCGPLNGRPP